MNLARRNLFQDKTRLAPSVGGVALAVLLILLLNGFLSGMYQQFSAYLDHAPGSVVVAQEGVRNLLGATSLLPTGTADSVRKVKGVSEIVPILSQFIILDLHGKKQPAYLVGYDPAIGGGPWRLAEGREPKADDEVVFDSVLARRHDVVLGDKFDIMGQGFTVVGLSAGTTSWMTSFFFIRKTAAESLLRAPGATSFLLVSPSVGIALEELRNRLDDLPGTEALLKHEMITNDQKLFARYSSAPIRLMVGIAFLVGTLVVGLVIYTATVERQREYGVLKAIGARNGVLYRVVTTQALIVTSIGSIAGVELALSAAQLIMTLRPQFLVTFEPTAVAWALIVGLAMALLAAFFPARVIAGLAPADVFRR
ncbi:MAG: ABC transporter permease [Chloroflexi bacterium]|nr:ABC transporter permease [Chloroflexota bacterium]